MSRPGPPCVPARRLILALCAAIVLAASAASAQRGGRFNSYRLATPESFDGAFNFCRVAFRQASNGDGGDWQVDYPDADRNLSVRLAELTKAPVSLDSRQEPNHLIVRLTDPEMFRCPFIMMTEVGSAFFDEDEARALREYLQKGGFLWADDFWGEYAWNVWESQIRKVLPSGAYPLVTLPMDHTMFHQVYQVPKVPQIPSINFWRGSGGDTSERGGDSRTATARAILDEHQRVMVLMTHNTDVGDSFEHEMRDREYFITFSVDGYALGINAIVYAMTH
jgi:hypothetical protein